MNDHLIECRHVSFNYPSRQQALQDLTFTVSEGECLGIIGANGAGKSTLLKLLVGLETGFEGEVKVLDMTITKKNLPKIRAKLGYVFQDSDSQLFMPSVETDIAFGPENYGFTPEKVKEVTDRALEMAGIEELRSRRVTELSGGQKKLVSLATVLALEPEILLFDEPTIALDPKNRRRIMEVIRSLGKTKLVVSHDLDLVYDICDRVLLLSEGRLIKEGPTELILSDEELLVEHGLELPLGLQKRGEKQGLLG